MANLALSSVAQICIEKYLSLKFNICKLTREKLTAGFLNLWKKVTLNKFFNTEFVENSAGREKIQLIIFYHTMKNDI